MNTKVCNQKTCKRQAAGKYKTCATCRERNKEWKRKRKKMASIAVPEKGHRYCKQCTRQWPLDHFQPMHNRRKKLTASCATCRLTLSKSHRGQGLSLIHI